MMIIIMMIMMIMMIMVQMQLVLLAMVLFVLMARSRALSMEFSILPISSVACQWGSWQGALRNLWICGPCLILYLSQIRERYKLWTQPRHVQTISNHFSICIKLYISADPPTPADARGSAPGNNTFDPCFGLLRQLLLLLLLLLLELPFEQKG